MPSPGMVLGWLGKRLPDLLIVFIAAMILGEVYLRTNLGREPEFAPDPVLGARFRPDQETVLGRLNSDGHRGPETDWSRPVVVGIGDSQAFGYGVADDEVWTTHLAEATGWQVVNAAHPAFGPCKQSVLLERVFERGGSSIRAVLIRVSITNAGFMPPSPEAVADIQRRTEERSRVRAWTHLGPALVKKLSQQWPSIVAALRGGSVPRPSRPREESLAEKMWDEQSPWWRIMADRCQRANVPVLFFIHDPTDLPSNRFLQQRLEEMARSRSMMSVVRLDSTAWDLRPGSSDQLHSQYLDRYSLHWDPHGNTEFHELVGRTLAEELRQRGILPEETALVSSEKGR